MKIFNKILRPITTFRRTAIQNELFHMPRAYFSSDITPIRMDMDVFFSEKTSQSAPPLIIMHGLLGSKQNWRGISRALEKKTLRKIYNVDARNHGDSPHNAEHSSAHMAADIVDLMKRENIERVSVMGHSMGGRTMMYFALKFPQLVEKIIVVDISPISIPNNFAEMEDIFNGMKKIKVSPTLSMPEARPVVTQQLKEWVRDKATVDFIMLNLKKLENGEFVWRPNIEALHQNFSNFRITQYFQDLPPYEGSVMFIAGKKSNFVDPNDWPQIKKIFPKAELKWLDATHLVHFDQPEQFMNLVTDFLKI